MRTSSADRGRLVSALVVLCGAVLGTLGGLALPSVGRTAAELTATSTVDATMTVPTCSRAWAAHVAAMSPALHWSFDTAGSPAGDLPSPGLLACDPSGALTLNGSVEEGWATTDPTLADGSTASAALKVRPVGAGGSGELLWLIQADGHGIGAHLADGVVQLVERPTGGGALAVLGSSPVPVEVEGRSLLVTVTQGAGIAVLWLDGTAAVIASPTVDPSGPVTAVAGAPDGTGLSAAPAAVDELVVLPIVLSGTDVAALVAADSW